MTMTPPPQIDAITIQTGDEPTFVFSRKPPDIDTFVQKSYTSSQTDDIRSLYVDIANYDENTEDLVKRVIHIFQEAAIRYKRVVKHEVQSPWFDKECEHGKNQKYFALRRFRKSGNSEDLNMNLCMRKPTIWVSDQVRHKPGCTVTGAG